MAVGVRDDINGFLPGRSPQSNLVQIERLPTTLPEMLETAGEQTAGQTVRLHFSSNASVEPTPRGSFRLEILAWDAAQQQFAELPALNVLLPAATPRPASGNLAAGTLYYGAPDASSRRTFEALFDVSGDTFLFKIRLTDPLNRSSERMVSGTITHDAAPNLADLRIRLERRDLFVFFESSTSTAQPREGQFRLEIGFAQSSSRIVQLLLARALHEIGVGALAKLRTSPVTAILRAPQTSPAAASEYGAVIKNFGPASPFQPPRHGRLIVQLTAPDGTTVRVEESI